MGFVTTAGSKQMRFKGVVKGVSNLFVAGQWVMSPGGLPIAVVSGKFAVQGIMEEMAMDKEMEVPDPEWLVAMLRK